MHTRLALATALLLPAAPAFAVPFISQVSPGNGPTRGGVPITITGSGFGSAGEVRIDDRPALVAEWSDLRIVCFTPEGDPGPRPLVVVAGGTPGSPVLFH